MPYGDPDPSDPQMLVCVAVPGDANTLRDMAYVFAEEFARLGFDERRLMRLFRTPFYAGLHQAYCALGEPAVTTIVRECIAAWRPGRRAPAAPSAEGA